MVNKLKFHCKLSAPAFPAGNLEKIRRKYQETVIGRSNVGNRCDPEAEGIGFASVQLPFAAVAAGVLMATLLGCLERTRGG